MQEAQAARSTQDVITRKLQEAQQKIQSTVNVSQTYEVQLDTLTEKVNALEKLLIAQRQKGQKLESELSAAQDRIGGAERRARLLEEENIKIKGELQSWDEYYQQEETSPEEPVSAPISNVSSVFDSPSWLNFSIPMSMPSDDFLFGIPASQSLSGPSMTTSNPAVSLTGEPFGQYTPFNANMEQRQSSGRRVSLVLYFMRAVEMVLAMVMEMVEMDQLQE